MEVICQHCSTIFNATRKDKRFCSNSCRSMKSSKERRLLARNPDKEIELRGGVVNDVGLFSPDYCEHNAKYLSVWQNVLNRTVYLDLNKNPSYAECFLNKEWYRFSNFKRWARLNYRAGWELDKDLLLEGNKEYGPDTCVYVPRYVNNCLKMSNKGSNRMLGVTLDKSGSYRAGISEFGVKISLGSYKDESDAHKAWQLRKSQYLQKIVVKYSQELGYDTRVAESITKISWDLLTQHSKNLETKGTK